MKTAVGELLSNPRESEYARFQMGQCCLIAKSEPLFSVEAAVRLFEECANSTNRTVAMLANCGLAHIDRENALAHGLRAAQLGPRGALVFSSLLLRLEGDENR